MGGLAVLQDMTRTILPPPGPNAYHSWTLMVWDGRVDTEATPPEREVPTQPPAGGVGEPALSVSTSVTSASTDADKSF